MQHGGGASSGERSGDLDLLLWLVELGRTDREQYRVMRAVLWELLRAERSLHSVKPSNCS